MTTEQAKTLCSFASAHRVALVSFIGGFDELRRSFFATVTNRTIVCHSNPSWANEHRVAPLVMNRTTTTHHYCRVREGSDVKGCNEIIKEVASVISAYSKAYTKIGEHYIQSHPHVWDDAAIAIITADLIADLPSLRCAIGYVVSQLSCGVSSFLETCRNEFLDVDLLPYMILDNIHIDPSCFPDGMHSHPREWFEQAEQRKVAQAMRAKQRRAEKKNLASASSPRPVPIITPRMAMLNQIAGVGLQPLGMN